MYSPLKNLRDLIQRSDAGFVNCHAHIDRAYTVNKDNLTKECERFLTEKWKLVDEIKMLQSEEQYFIRMKYAIDKQYSVGVRSLCSFIDVDSVVGLKAFNAAKKIQSNPSEKMNFKIACQTLKGVVLRGERSIVESVIDDFDIIGSLPAADEDIDKHLDVVMSWAKDTGKRLHIHVDQLNLPEEDETSVVLSKIEQYGLEGRVSCIHGISIASKVKEKRYEIYAKSKDLGVSFIACPSAWIDHRRSDALQPWHNSTTPVEEMLDFGISVGLGSDNIFDIYKPFSDGDMMTELRFILESCHIYDIKKLIYLATNIGIIK